jgi:hypothetical protein
MIPDRDRSGVVVVLVGLVQLTDVLEEVRPTEGAEIAAAPDGAHCGPRPSEMVPSEENDPTPIDSSQARGVPEGGFRPFHRRHRPSHRNSLSADRLKKEERGLLG